MSEVLPPLVHYITVNKDDGLSTFQEPAEEPKFQNLASGSRMAYLYSAPAAFSIDKGSDLAYHQTAPSSPPLRTFPPAGASSLIAVDVAPSASDEPAAGMHRTQTLDYLIVLEGEMELTLNGGEKKIVKRGEVVIQRAAIHCWKNTSKTNSARMLCVSIGSEGAVDGGVEFIS